MLTNISFNLINRVKYQLCQSQKWQYHLCWDELCARRTKSTKKPQNRTTFLIIVKNHKKRKLQDFFLTLLRWGLYTVLQFLSYTVWQASLGCVCCWFALLSAEFFWLEHVFFMATRHWIMVSYSVSWIVSNLSWHKFPASSKKEK